MGVQGWRKVQKMSNKIVFDTKIGAFLVVEEDGAVCEVRIGGRRLFSDETLECLDFEETALLRQAKRELIEYAEGKRIHFDLPLTVRGTEFQKKVWDALCTIPYGETKTYRQIAEQVGSPRGYRAVGMANHRNPIGVIIPCHRVVGSDGTLTGYAEGLDKKRALLELEQRGLERQNY